ncbi:MAG TPA: GNAT family N-acetyltransferase [Clostridiaceae bacterium]
MSKSFEIRKIRKEERVIASKIQSISFNSGGDFKPLDAEPTKLTKGYENCRAAFNEEGKMCSCFELIPFEAIFQGSKVKIAGIGGVASLPEERKTGFIREIFKASFKEMKENNQILSFLYPFSHVYYRKFGYEAAMKRSTWRIPLTSFSCFKSQGKVKMYIPNESRKDIEDIYNVFIIDKNMSLVRDDALWDNHIGRDPYKNNEYTYVWYKDNGEAGSYITFKAVRRETFNVNMQVKELIWKDKLSLLGILGFLKSFVPSYVDFIWEASEFFNLSHLFLEPYDVKLEKSSAGMSRIVDLEKVLKLYFSSVSKLINSGEITLQVEDTFLDWNKGIYKVSWKAGVVEIYKEDGIVDISLSIQRLTQLLTGFADLSDFIYNDDVKILGKYDLLLSVFKKKDVFLNDYF